MTIEAIRTPAPGAPTNSERTRAAAQDFEAMLLAQMLRTAREYGSSEESGEMMDMAEQQFAAVMAKNGGLGLARMIAAGLNKNS